MRAEDGGPSVPVVPVSPFTSPSTCRSDIGVDEVDRCRVTVRVVAAAARASRQTTLMEALRGLTSRTQSTSAAVRSTPTGVERCAPGSRYELLALHNSQLDACLRDVRCPDSDAESVRRGACLLGYSISRRYRSVAAGAVLSWSETAESTGQFNVYVDDLGRIDGLLTWAWISEWTRCRLTNETNPEIHPSEWNEGRQLWFRDVVASASCAERMAFDMLEIGERCPAALMSVRSRINGAHELIDLRGSDLTVLSRWLATGASST